MSLTNSQYDTLMRSYSKKQLNAARDLEYRRREVYEKLPELARLDSEIGQSATDYLQARFEGRQVAASFKEVSDRIAARRAQCLKEAGYAPDYLEAHYECPDCKDTGYIGSQRCHCFKQAAIDLLYTQSGLKEVLQEENFDTFSFDYYPENLIDPASGLSSREIMIKNMMRLRQFLNEFDQKGGNLLLMGGPGLGKTFVSHCIARELLESSHSVIYYSSGDLFDLAAQETFRSSYSSDTKGSTDAQGTFRELTGDCDLLIIDDLGTELTNAFTSSTLFHVLNDRLARNKSTIISTNLSLEALRDVYSERIFSRVLSAFEAIGFFGNDIRLKKKLEQTGGYTG